METSLAITSNLPFTKEDINKLANPILGIAKDGEPGHLASTADKSTRTSFESEPMNLNPLQHLLIKSPNLGTFNTLDSHGQRTIVKKIPATVGANGIIVDFIRSGIDHLDCSKQTVRNLEFQITDEVGNEIAIANGEVSFSIVFTTKASDRKKKHTKNNHQMYPQTSLKLCFYSPWT